MYPLYETLKQQVPLLKRSPGDWIAELMQWHFSEETGSIYWLEQKKNLSFDPLHDIREVNDLKLFGLFDKNVLIQRPVNDLVPKGFKHRPRRIFETGGTTGHPCRIAEFESENFNVDVYAAMLAARGLHGGDALAMAPSGPHAYGNFISRLMDRFQANAFFIDFDPRWVKKLINDGHSTETYIDHLVQQAGLILHTQKISFLFTTTRLLMELVLKLDRPLQAYGIQAVCTGGTSLSKEEARVLEREYLQGIIWIDTYGNTLMRGHALQADPSSAEEQRSYYLLPPVGYLRVADPGDWSRTVDYGERGQIIVTTLFRDVFIPNLAERDSAVKVQPHAWFPWDGVSQIESVNKADPKTIIEGVY